MRAMPSFTSSAVPTSRTSISARSAAWISLRRISLSSPGLRMESVAMGYRLGDCEKYHKNAGRGAEDVHHRPYRVPGIAQQIGGAGRAREVDDPLQVGSATRGELA